MLLSELIYQNRRKLHLSRKELAEEINVSESTISDWEIGISEPTFNQKKRLAELFKIEIEEELQENSCKSKKYDFKYMGKFKIWVFICMILWVVGHVFDSLGSNLISKDYDTLGLILQILSPFTLVCAITIFGIKVIQYLTFYKESELKFEYNKTGAIWFISFVILVILKYFVNYAITFFRSLEKYHPHKYYYWIVFAIASIVVFSLILHLFNYKFKWNKFTKILIIAISFIMFLFFIIGELVTDFYEAFYILTILLVITIILLFFNFKYKTMELNE